MKTKSFKQKSGRVLPYDESKVRAVAEARTVREYTEARRALNALWRAREDSDPVAAGDGATAPAPSAALVKETS